MCRFMLRLSSEIFIYETSVPELDVTPSVLSMGSMPEAFYSMIINEVV